MTDSFVFYRSFADALDELEPEQYRAAAHAITRYALDHEEAVGLTGAAKVAYIMAKPIIDANAQRRENGRKGAEYGKLGGRPRKNAQDDGTKTPEGIVSETPEGISGQTPNEDVNEDEKMEMSNEKGDEKKYSTEFASFWDIYPRKADKGQAYKKYCERLNDGFSPAELISAAKAYRQECERQRTEQRYIKLAKTFLGDSQPFADFLPGKQMDQPQKLEIKEGENPYLTLLNRGGMNDGESE